MLRARGVVGLVWFTSSHGHADRPSSLLPLLPGDLTLALTHLNRSLELDQANEEAMTWQATALQDLQVHRGPIGPLGLGRLWRGCLFIHMVDHVGG